MPYKRIPESTIAAALGTLVAGLVSTLIYMAQQKALELVQKKISELVAKVTANIANKVAETICSDLEGIQGAINGVKGGIATVDKYLTILHTTAVSLKIPITALKVAIKIIKALPIPQATLVVSFTVLESDMLELLEETVKQIDEIVNALLVVSSTLLGFAKTAATMTSLADGLVAALAACSTLNGTGCSPAEMTDEDKAKLTESGILDPETGQDIFSKVADAATSGAGFLSQGDLPKGSVTDPRYSTLDSKNLLGTSTTSTSSGSENGSGEGTGTNGGSGNGQGVGGNTTGGSTGSEGNGTGGGSSTSTGSLDGTGENQKGSGSGSVDLGDVSKLSEVDLSYVSDTALDNIVSLGSIGDTFEWQGREVTILDPKKPGSSPGFIKLPKDPETGEPDYLGFIQDKLQDLSDLGLSDGLRDAFRDIAFTREEKSQKGSIEGLTEQYLSSTGKTYTMRIYKDTTYVSLATRHLVRAYDGRGTFVLEGPVSFTLDPDVLFSDMKVRLDQLTL